MVEITKICCFGSIICLVVLSYLLLMPDVMEYIIAASILLGIFTLGVFPLALELTVEATYPADQVIFILYTVCLNKHGNLLDILNHVLQVFFILYLVS